MFILYIYIYIHSYFRVGHSCLVSVLSYSVIALNTGWLLMSDSCFQPAGDHFRGASEASERLRVLVRPEACQTVSGVPGSRRGQKTKEAACRCSKGRYPVVQDAAGGLPERRAVPLRTGRGLGSVCQAGSAESVAGARWEQRLTDGALNVSHWNTNTPSPPAHPGSKSSLLNHVLVLKSRGQEVKQGVLAL